MQTETEKVLDGTTRGLNTASMPADRTQENQGLGKVPKPIPASVETLLPQNLGKSCREWPAGKTDSEIKLLI